MAENDHKLEIPDELVTSKIYLIRHKKVMLDEDLAELYGVTTGNLNKAVKRNIARFPEDFMFQLTKEEFDNLLFQIGRSSWGGRRTPPNAFAEQGVAMLSGVLHSERAIKVNIQIMRVFTRLREMLADTLSLKLDIEEIKKKLQTQDNSAPKPINKVIQSPSVVREVLKINFRGYEMITKGDISSCF